VHNFFARVNRAPVSAPASFGAAEFFARAHVKQVRVFICFYIRSSDSIGISRNSQTEARKFSELRNDCAPRDAGELSRRRIML
jgi:hypothetical protein